VFFIHDLWVSVPNSSVFCCFGVILQLQMVLTAFAIAKEIGGIVDTQLNDVVITSASKLEEGNGNSLGFFSNPKYEQSLYETQCGAVIVPMGFKAQKPVSTLLIEHPNPYLSLIHI
jgi:UDP-3-O-[3-hydroxymyristoyl] glucosamine N-acyltransferase